MLVAVDLVCIYLQFTDPFTIYHAAFLGEVCCGSAFCPLFFHIVFFYSLFSLFLLREITWFCLVPEVRSKVLDLFYAFYFFFLNITALGRRGRRLETLLLVKLSSGF